MGDSAFVAKPKKVKGKRPPQTKDVIEFNILVMRQVTTKAAKTGKRGKVLRPAKAGSYATGLLKWGEDTYEARSGPWGKGTLPDGFYTVDNRITAFSTSSLKGGMKIQLPDDDDADTDPQLVGFRIPIEPEATNTGRSLLRIHPDGGSSEGTEGCIGLVGEDAAAFWERWKTTPRHNRPARLQVSSGKATKGEAEDWTKKKVGHE